MTSLHVHTETADLRGQPEEDSQMYPYMHHTPVQNIWCDLSKKKKQSKEENLKFIIYKKEYRPDYNATSKPFISGPFENTTIFESFKSCE